MSFGSTPVSTTTLGSNQFPVSAVYVPNTSGGNFTAVQGGPASSADSQGNVSAPIAIYAYAASFVDGSDATLGATTDASSANTLIGLTKAIKANTASVVIGSGTVTANQGGTWTVAGSGNFNNASIGATGSAVPASASYIGGNKAGNLVGVSLDSSGNLNVNVAAGGASGGTSSSFGAAFPSTGTAIGASDGTNMQGLLLESSSNKNLRVGIYSGANEVTVTGANALKVDNSAVTQPVSGTVTANIGTTNGLALDTSVNGILLSQASTTSGEKGPLIQGAVTTNAPSYTTAQTDPLSLDTSGLLRVSIKDTPSNTNNFNVNIAASTATVTVSGTVTSNQGGSNWSTNVAQIGGTNVVTGGANGLLAVAGPVASGASNADNPIKAGGVFNTTQPTVTTGQIVDLQATARGAMIVATGVDAFAVNASQTGTWTVQQGGSNWSVNIAQVAGGTASNAGQAGALQVGGAVATNNNVSSATNPLLIAGSDYGGTPKVQTWKVDSSGNGQVAVTNTPSVAQSGTWTIQPGNTANTTPWLVQTVTGTSGGSTPYHNVVSSGTNGTNVKASAGQVYEGIISNTSSSPVYFRFYDTNGTPTVGTTTVKRTMQVLGNGTLPFSWPNGLKFTSGIAYGITTLIADNDTTAISSSVSIDFGYD